MYHVACDQPYSGLDKTWQRAVALAVGLGWDLGGLLSSLGLCFASETVRSTCSSQGVDSVSWWGERWSLSVSLNQVRLYSQMPLSAASIT